jgi:hypothetical protein
MVILPLHLKPCHYAPCLAMIKESYKPRRLYPKRLPGVRDRAYNFGRCRPHNTLEPGASGRPQQFWGRAKGVQPHSRPLESPVPLDSEMVGKYLHAWWTPMFPGAFRNPTLIAIGKPIRRSEEVN